MVKISKKGEFIPTSPIRKLVPYAEQAAARGIKIYRLNIGQPDIPTPEVALNAIRNIKANPIEYQHSAGIESYRRKLVGYYKKVGIDVSYEDILVTTGGSEALTMVMNVCFDAGDEILVPEPFYANYNSFAVQTDAIIRPIPSTIENDFALPPISEFEKHIGPRTKAILICNPNNPTGYMYSGEELNQLRDIVLRHDLFFISDEAYREFCYDGTKHISIMSLEGLEQNAIMIDSVSKRYSMCGLRLGTFVTKNRDVIAYAMKIAQSRLCSPYVAQVAAEAALDTPQSYFDDVYNEYIERRNYLVDALNHMPGVYSPMPKGAFYTTARLPIDDSDRFSQWLLEEFDYQGQTVMLAPATGFYITPGKGKDEVRIGYVLKIDDLKAAMKCLAEALKVYPGRTTK